MVDVHTTPDGSQPLFAGVQRETARLANDLRQAAGKRWELARLELAIAALQVKRLTIWLAAVGLALLTLLPLLIVLAADWLGEVTRYSRTSWLLLFVLILAIGAPGAAWFAWRRFRAEFVGLEATLEELREDRRWFDEYAARWGVGETHSAD